MDKEVARIIQKCVQILAAKAPQLQEIEKLAFELVEFAFGPRKVLYHVLLVAFLQAAGMGLKLTRDGFKYSYSFLSSKGKKNLELLKQMSNASNYAEWRKLAIELDTLMGADKWRAKDESSLIDSKIIKRRIADTNDMMRRGDIFDLMFRLRGGLARDQFGMQNEKLFRNAFSGSKLLVERYHQTIADALNYICDTESTIEEIPIDAKLAFFNETRHAFGRTALLLSGGAYLGYYHVGVAKTLHDEGLLPRVISGASAGSLMAAAIGTRTEDEFSEIYDVSSGRFRHDFFKFITEIQHPTGRQIELLIPRFLRWIFHPLLSVIFDKKLIHVDSQHFVKVVQHNSGNYTFQEAFDRTGRIINITVAPLNPHDPPRLLNYLTAPHVCVWSAAVASCAIPGVFDSATLVVKEPNGNFRPEHEWNNQGGGDSDVKIANSYSDGSIENDLPMQQLSEFFNVNHFIVSQVNFHSALLSSLSMRGAKQDSIFSSPLLYGIVGYVRFLKAQMKDWIKNLVKFFNHSLAGSAPAWTRGLVALVTQDYEGRDHDVTIMPWAGHIGLLEAGLSVIKNPTLAEYQEVVKVAAAHTYPYIPRIRAHCDTEMTLDRCVQRLRRRVAEMQSEDEEPASTSIQDSKNRLGHKRLVNRSDRTPSFYTSRSIVNLSGLSVADPAPMVVGPTPPQSPGSSLSNMHQAPMASTGSGSGSGTPTSPSTGMRKLFGSFKELQSSPGAIESGNTEVASLNVSHNSLRSRADSLDFQIESSVSLEDEDNKFSYSLSVPSVDNANQSQRRPSQEGREGSHSGKITKTTSMASFYYRRNSAI